MTPHVTTTATENQATVVDLSDTVPEPPKRRRGRPPGSKNKPKDGTTSRTTRKRAATSTAPRIPRIAKAAESRVCLIEKGEDGTKFTFFDESGVETLVRTVPMQKGWVLDRR